MPFYLQRCATFCFGSELNSLIFVRYFPCFLDLIDFSSDRFLLGLCNDLFHCFPLKPHLTKKSYCYWIIIVQLILLMN